jgi:hypothetical protein
MLKILEFKKKGAPGKKIENNLIKFIMYSRDVKFESIFTILRNPLLSPPISSFLLYSNPGSYEHVLIKFRIGEPMVVGSILDEVIF